MNITTSLKELDYSMKTQPCVRGEPPVRRFKMLKLNTIHCIDARSGLKSLPDASIDCIVTSPPYWALRDYELQPLVWGGKAECAHRFASHLIREQRKLTHGITDAVNEKLATQTCEVCSAWRGSLGLEPSLELYVEHLCMIFDEAWRVLKPTGTLWVNLGDTYVGSWGSSGPHRSSTHTKQDRTGSWFRPGYDDMAVSPPSSMEQVVARRSLCQIPARFAIAMANRGWIVRNDIVWHKPNHMPASVKNRFTTSWEHLFLFVRSERYYFDLDAVRVPHTSLKKAKIPGPARWSPHLHGLRRPPRGGEEGSMHPLGKNPGDFWTIPAETRTLGAILGPSGAVKVPGGSGWVGHPGGGQSRIVRERDPRCLSPNGKNPGDVWDVKTVSSKWGHFATFPEGLVERPIKAGCPAEVCVKCGIPQMSRFTKLARNELILGCNCGAKSMPGIVLDPFMGSGTTAVVAKRLGRQFLGFEMNANYVELAMKRLEILNVESTPNADAA